MKNLVRKLRLLFIEWEIMRAESSIAISRANLYVLVQKRDELKSARLWAKKTRKVPRAESKFKNPRPSAAKGVR